MKNFLSKYLLLITIFLIQGFALVQWIGQTEIASQAHFSSFDLQLRLIENIHNDRTIPLWEVRLFHNKLIGSLFDIFGHYLQFWNLVFLSAFFSLAGVVGLGAGLYYFFSRKKHWILWLLFGYLLLVPFVEIFGSSTVSYNIRLILVAIPFLFWSLFGYWHVLQEKKIGWIWIVLLLLLSIWYQLALV